jgi:uncharacterized protein
MSRMKLSRVFRDERSAGFFEASAQDRLAMRRCTVCGHVGPAHAMVCSSCQSPDLAWTDVQLTGTVVSWVVMHGRAGRDGAMPEPVLIVAVELADGPWLNGRLIDVHTDEVHAGLAVHVSFEHPGEGEEGESVPVFRRP